MNINRSRGIAPRAIDEMASIIDRNVASVSAGRLRPLVDARDEGHCDSEHGAGGNKERGQVK